MKSGSARASDSQHPPKPHRAIGIDAGRIVMAFLVVILHTLPRAFSELAVVGMMCRCAVPFFLITSGYLLKIPERLTFVIIAKPLMRLLPIYVVWMVIYYGVANILEMRPSSLAFRDLLSGGIAFPLWYLPALGVALVAVPTAILSMGVRITGLICASLAIAAIARSTYHDVLLLPGAPARGGLMVAPLFVFIGQWLRRKDFALGPLRAIAIALLGIALLIAEEVWLARHLQVPLISHDFTFGVIIYGVGAFLLARSLPRTHFVERIAVLGLYAFGVYLSHLLFIWAMNLASGPVAPLGFLWRAPLAFACALALTVTVSRRPYVRRLVT